MSELDDVLSLFICCKVCNFLFGFIYIDFNFGLFLGCIRRFKDYEKQLPESKGSSFFSLLLHHFCSLGFVLIGFVLLLIQFWRKRLALMKIWLGSFENNLRFTLFISPSCNYVTLLDLVHSFVTLCLLVSADVYFFPPSS